MTPSGAARQSSRTGVACCTAPCRKALSSRRSAAARTGGPGLLKVMITLAAASRSMPYLPIA